MAAIERVTASFGATLNAGNYESVRVDVQFEARVEEGEDPHTAARWLMQQAKDHVREASAAAKRAAREGAD